ncbi:MAG: peptidoglycan DD-metalloendopeptidase family protein [Coriobacteriia bacterium]|nr:peptidoglycan DD-metalloendopeptidase family protein [Coriobacteriia bacterium]MBN2841163.1 peptidoglycan DD-metalloendopeptidase family protein [Coriobacteriia bacterium]
MHRSRALSLAIILGLSWSLLVSPFAFAATVDDLRAHERAAEEARDAAAAAESAAKKLAAEVQALDATIASIQGEISALADDIAVATERTNRLEAEVAELTARVAAKESEIAATQAEYERQQALLSNRIESSYKTGDLAYFELLLESKSIEDFITRTTLVQRVIKSNTELADGLKASRITLEKIKAEIERDRETVDAKRAEAEAEEKRLLDLRNRHQAKLDAQQTAQDQKEALVAENKANAARLRAQAEAEEAESAKIARELYGTGSGYFAGVMAFPVPGFEQTPTGGSAFGYRIHPILGYRKMHTGIDIGGRAVGRNINGATIVAAADGKVIYTGYRGGYGYCTIIDHGNGVTTLYAHQLAGSISVSTGQSVSKRDPIGKVGSTGLSTGPHLHFEVRVNGNPVDPMKYLK